MIKEDATHLLACKHCRNTDQCKYYDMYCILIGITKTGKAKVLVFGERNWKLKENIKLSIRYVNLKKVRELLK